MLSRVVFGSLMIQPMWLPAPLIQSVVVILLKYVVLASLPGGVTVLGIIRLNLTRSAPSWVTVGIVPTTRATKSKDQAKVHQPEERTNNTHDTTAPVHIFVGVLTECSWGILFAVLVLWKVSLSYHVAHVVPKRGD
jgi:hypothetical protein